MMSTLRQPYNELSPEVYNALVQASIALYKALGGGWQTL
mgnify:CR=1 FL=1